MTTRWLVELFEEIAMRVTYYPCEGKRRMGRKGLVREVVRSSTPVKATVFNVPEGSTLPYIVQELLRYAKPLAVNIWINGRLIGAPDDETRRMTVDQGQHVVLLQDLSGDALHGLSWIVCTETEEPAESA